MLGAAEYPGVVQSPDQGLSHPTDGFDREHLALNPVQVDQIRLPSVDFAVRAAGQPATTVQDGILAALQPIELIA
jgi:hypothetical protein